MKTAMIRVNLPLTQDQRARGVIFSSTLSNSRKEQPGDKVHEIFEDTPDKQSKIDALNNDHLFEDSPWSYNIVRSR